MLNLYKSLMKQKQEQQQEDQRPIRNHSNIKSYENHPPSYYNLYGNSNETPIIPLNEKQEEKEEKIPLNEKQKNEYLIINIDNCPKIRNIHDMKVEDILTKDEFETLKRGGKVQLRIKKS